MDIREHLLKTREQTLTYYELPEIELSKNYGEGKWTVRQILVHLADTETVLYDRIRRVISEPKQVIWAFNPDAWANTLDYHHFPLTLSKNVYASVRDCIIYLAEQHYENKGANEFIHSHTGLRTLKDEFDKVAEHNYNHLRQIEQALKS